MGQNPKAFIPALRFDFLTRYFDPLVRHTTREYTFKRALVAQADLQNGQKILDIACGTGTLAVGIKKKFAGAELFAVDADAQILHQARAKAALNKVEIDFRQTFSDELPFAAETFDRVFSTLFFHHLTLENKIRTFREILRVLKPRGEFHLADFALPRDKTQFILSKYVQLFDGYASTHDNLRGRLKILMEESGFAEVERTGYFRTIIGTIRLFKAKKI
jgi:ubiquinone/menaquinone biosynthesis C-methylase UbiE